MLPFPQQWPGAQSWGDGIHLTLTGYCLLVSYPHNYSAAQSPSWVTAPEPSVLCKHSYISEWNRCVFIWQRGDVIKRKRSPREFFIWHCIQAISQLNIFHDRMQLAAYLGQRCVKRRASVLLSTQGPLVLYDYTARVMCSELEIKSHLLYYIYIN